MILDDKRNELKLIHLEKINITTKEDTNNKKFCLLKPNETIYLYSEKKEKESYIKLEIKIKIVYSGQKIKPSLKFKTSKWNEDKFEVVKSQRKKEIYELDNKITPCLNNLLNLIDDSIKKSNIFLNNKKMDWGELNKPIKIDLNSQISHIYENNTKIINALKNKTRDEKIKIANVLGKDWHKVIYLNSLIEFQNELKNKLEDFSITKERDLQFHLKKYEHILPIILPGITSSSKIKYEEYINDNALENKNRIDMEINLSDIQIIELKKSKFKILKNIKIKNVFAATSELSNAVQQAEFYLRIKQNNNQNKLYDFPTNTIVIIGNKEKELEGIDNDKDKENWKTSFSVYKNSLKNTTIITWDELLEKVTTTITILKQNNNINN